jgi:hypothetical protein
VQFFSDAKPFTRQRTLPLAVLASGLLWGLDGLLVGEDRKLVTLGAIWLSWALWRVLSRSVRKRDAAEEEQAEPA